MRLHRGAVSPRAYPPPLPLVLLLLLLPKWPAPPGQQPTFEFAMAVDLPRHPNATLPANVLGLRALRDAVPSQAPASFVLSSWDFRADPCGRAHCRSAAITGGAPDLMAQLNAYPASDVVKAMPGNGPYGANGTQSALRGGNADEGQRRSAPLDPCAFEGIACEGWAVTEVRLPGQHLLLSELPADLSLLDSLRALDLSDNGLSGRLQASHLPASLEGLSLAMNHLTGRLPSDLSSLRALRVLNLADNGFQGGLPPELSALRCLAVLDLSRNHLYGPLPPSLDALSPTMRELHLADNCGLCGAAGTRSRRPQLVGAVEKLSIRGTHLAENCMNPGIRCPPAGTTSKHLTLGVQILAIIIFVLLACVLICILCSYFGHPSILCCPHRARWLRSERGNLAAITAFAAALPGRNSPAPGEGSPATGGESQPQELKARKSQPIEAVIINPGSTVLSPNLCVAISVTLDGNHDVINRTQSASAAVPPPTAPATGRHADGAGPSETAATPPLTGFRSVPAPIRPVGVMTPPLDSASAFRRARRLFTSAPERDTPSAPAPESGAEVSAGDALRQGAEESTNTGGQAEAGEHTGENSGSSGMTAEHQQAAQTEVATPQYPSPPVARRSGGEQEGFELPELR
eukprot:jgi/Tetstr1/422504/TSEL_001266.t1